MMKHVAIFSSYLLSHYLVEFRLYVLVCVCLGSHDVSSFLWGQESFLILINAQYLLTGAIGSETVGMLLMCFRAGLITQSQWLFRGKKAQFSGTLRFRG